MWSRTSPSFLSQQKSAWNSVDKPLAVLRRCWKVECPLAHSLQAGWWGVWPCRLCVARSTCSDFETGHKHDSDCCEPSAKPERANLWFIQSSSKLFHGCKRTQGQPQKYETSIMVAPSLCFKEKLSGVCEKYHPDWHKRVVDSMLCWILPTKTCILAFFQTGGNPCFPFSDTSMDTCRLAIPRIPTSPPLAVLKLGIPTSNGSSIPNARMHDSARTVALAPLSSNHQEASS